MDSLEYTGEIRYITSTQNMNATSYFFFFLTLRIVLVFFFVLAYVNYRNPGIKLTQIEQKKLVPCILPSFWCLNLKHKIVRVLINYRCTGFEDFLFKSLCMYVCVCVYVCICVYVCAHACADVYPYEYSLIIINSASLLMTEEAKVKDNDI